MRIQRRTFGKLAAGAAAGIAAPAIAQNKPFTIGFSMNLTGPLAPNGKAALLAVADLGRGHQRQGRPARPAGEAGLLRRPVESLDHSRPLHQADGRRQGRHHRLELRDQHDRAGDADRDAARPDVLLAARPRGEQRVQLQALLLDDADRRPAAQGVVRRGLLRGRGRADSQADDRGDVRRRRRVPAQRHGRRAQRDQAARAQDRLRQDLSADHVRLHAGGAGDRGDQSRHLPRLLLSGRHGRPHPGQPRGRLQAQDLRRRHGRPAGDGHQDAARAAPERHRGLRLLAAVGGLRLRRGPRRS